MRWTILSTIIPEAPMTILGKILAYADLNAFGRQDFLLRNDHLRRELALFGKVYSDVEWFTLQLKFIEKHNFFTASARTLYNAQKTINIAALKRALESLPQRE